jgi:hypothetical protein
LHVCCLTFRDPYILIYGLIYGKKFGITFEFVVNESKIFLNFDLVFLLPKKIVETWTGIPIRLANHLLLWSKVGAVGSFVCSGRLLYQ